MKKSFFVLFILFAFTCATAQTVQKGYVKTKGRLDKNGQLIPGTRLSGASIMLLNGHSTVSDADGNFSLTLPDKKFYLNNVLKQGFVLTDPEVLKKEYTYSANPLVITMETPEKKLQDQIETQRKIESTLRKQLRQREEELDSLLKINKLTEDEYYQKIQQLYDDKTNEKLVKEMSRRYAEMDFDLIDSFQLQLCFFIMNGELTKADSLINSKGDILADIATLNTLRIANEKEEKKLDKRQQTLDSSILYEQWQQQHLAQLCTDKIETFRKMNQTDSVAYYLATRATIDNANVTWQLEAARYLDQQLSDYPKALVYYRRALKQLEATYGKNHPDTQAVARRIKEIDK